MGCCNVNQDNQYDLIIVGGGSAAFAAAIKANDKELKTLMVNGGLPLGGTCVNVGCVPSKFFIRAAESFHKASHTSFKGISIKKPDLDFSQVVQQKNELVSGMQQRKYIDLLQGLSHVKVIEGIAHFVGDRTIEVEGEHFEGLKIIIATGASTYIPPIKGIETVPFLTNISLFEMDNLPASMIILGAGYIALEIAQAYNRFGTKVTVLQRSETILSKQSKDVSNEILQHLRDDGINIITQASINKVWKEGNIIHLNYDCHGSNETISATHILVATGTKANTGKLNTSKTSVKVDEKGSIIVDHYLRTSHPDIFATGDVTNLPAYVYTAAYEGGIAVNNAFNDTLQKTNFTALPWVVFTDPQVAGVGMDENEAKEKEIPYQVTTLQLADVPKSIAALDTRGFIKLIRNTETDLLIGARIIASEGSELAMEISLAIKYKILVTDLVNMFHPYLTLSEGIKLAALSFTTDVKKMSCCAS